MSFHLNQLDYAALLVQPDLQAFQNALSRTLATDFVDLLAQSAVTMGLPSSPNGDQPAITQVSLVSSYPTQPQLEYVEYLRLDVGDYLDCCQRYISQANAADATSLAAWLMSEHDLWFDPAKLTLSDVTQDPTRSDRQLMTFSVDATNYVWVGHATLYVVDASHLALLAYPGVARGLQWSDVDLPPSP